MFLFGASGDFLIKKRNLPAKRIDHAEHDVDHCSNRLGGFCNRNFRPGQRA